MPSTVAVACALLVVVGSSSLLAQSGKTETVINGRSLTAQQKADFVRIYGTPPLAGNFWYDARSGLWGVVGHEAFGILRPGHQFGTLLPTASSGTTGVFINGRQIICPDGGADRAAMPRG